jgi:cytochrome c biogenesis protein CcdA
MSFFAVELGLSVHLPAHETEYQIMLLILLAYFGGVLAILSPCILPILRRLTRSCN